MPITTILRFILYNCVRAILAEIETAVNDCCRKCDVNSSRRPGPNGEGDEEARSVSFRPVFVGLLGVSPTVGPK
jgi:hypothetical protein